MVIYLLVTKQQRRSPGSPYYLNQCYLINQIESKAGRPFPSPFWLTIYKQHDAYEMISNIPRPYQKRTFYQLTRKESCLCHSKAYLAIAYCRNVRL